MSVSRSIEEIINSEGIITYKVIGKSMEPMIVPNKDLVTIRRKRDNEYFSENDVILYRQKDKLILHRITSVLPKGEYVLLGDNCSIREYGIKNSDILGVLISFKHNGIHYDVSDVKYLKYIQELRNKERERIVRKRIYDISIQHLNFLPDTWMTYIKNFLKRKLVCKIEFI